MKSLKDLLNFKQTNRNYKNFSKSKDVFDFLSLIEKWPIIVGPYLSKHTIPLKNHSKTLTILSNHPSVAQELGLLEETVKEKIFKSFPELKSSIKRLQFITNNEHFSRQKKMEEKNLLLKKSPSQQKNTRQELHPQSPQYKVLKKQACEILGTEIDDDEIKEMLISLYIQQKT